jgi:hypothetical protein
MTKYNEDGMKILEQILPYFKPETTVSVKMIDALNTYVDIPIVLSSVSQEDTYEADFQTRRALIWTLNFTMKAYYFGPVSTKKQIKFVDVDLYPSYAISDGGSQIEITPAVPVSVSSLTNGTAYRIYDLGSASSTANQASWNTYLGAVGQSYKVGDTFTATSGTAPTGATATLPHGSIDIDDDWKHLVIKSDGDGLI